MPKSFLQESLVPNIIPSQYTQVYPTMLNWNAGHTPYHHPTPLQSPSAQWQAASARPPGTVSLGSRRSYDTASSRAPSHPYIPTPPPAERRADNIEQMYSPGVLASLGLSNGCRSQSAHDRAPIPKDDDHFLPPYPTLSETEAGDGSVIHPPSSHPPASLSWHRTLPDGRSCYFPCFWWIWGPKIVVSKLHIALFFCHAKSLMQLPDRPDPIHVYQCGICKTRYIYWQNNGKWEIIDRMSGDRWLQCFGDDIADSPPYPPPVPNAPDHSCSIWNPPSGPPALTLSSSAGRQGSLGPPPYSSLHSISPHWLPSPPLLELRCGSNSAGNSDATRVCNAPIRGPEMVDSKIRMAIFFCHGKRSAQPRQPPDAVWVYRCDECETRHTYWWNNGAWEWIDSMSKDEWRRCFGGGDDVDDDAWAGVGSILRTPSNRLARRA